MKFTITYETENEIHYKRMCDLIEELESVKENGN